MTFNEQAVIEYVTKQRWYGAKSRSVAHSQVLDAVELRTTEPGFTLELVEMRYETGAHDIYQLVHGETEIDGLDNPAAARELVHAMRGGLTLQGANGTIEFRPVEGFAGLGGQLHEARPVCGEQSKKSHRATLSPAGASISAALPPRLGLVESLPRQLSSACSSTKCSVMAG